MPGTMKMFCIRMNILSHRNNIELFLVCNMAAMQHGRQATWPPCKTSIGIAKVFYLEGGMVGDWAD